MNTTVNTTVITIVNDITITITVTTPIEHFDHVSCPTSLDVFVVL